MRFLLSPIIVFCVVELIIGLPVVKHRGEEAKNEIDTDAEVHGIKIRESSNDIFNASNLHMRSNWDEERRIKLELLRQFYNRERELENGEALNPFKHHENGDPAQIHAAEIAEVKKSITKITAELNEIDHKRRELFKEYEMEKKFNEEQKEKGNGELDEEKRKQYHEEQEKLKEKHKKHDPLHHPGSKQQLEEVWKEQDHINQEFDPKAFFQLHDLDSNGVWDQDEVKSLFLQELDKMYQEGTPEDDLFERREEMERMREHVFKESDINKNGFIDYHEFLRQIQEPEPQKEAGWKGLDEQEIYTQEDYDNYVRYHHQQQQQQQAAYAAANGVPPPHTNYQQLPPPQQMNPNVQYHQGQVPHPAQYQNQMPQYQQYQDQHQQQQMPVHQQQQPGQYQNAHVQQQQYQGSHQQYQMPPQYVPRDQIPLEGQYHQQVLQKPSQNIPNQPNVQAQQQLHQQPQQQQQQHQPPPPPQHQQQQITQNNIQQQQINNENSNAQVLPVHKIENQHTSNDGEIKNAHAAAAPASAAAGTNVNHV